MTNTPKDNSLDEVRLEKGAVVFMKAGSGLQGYGNEQCVSWYSPEIDELSLYGHNEHYHGYQVSKIVSTPTTLLKEAERKGRVAELRKFNDAFDDLHQNTEGAGVVSYPEMGEWIDARFNDLEALAQQTEED